MADDWTAERFVAAAVHDLKEPLNGAIGYLDLVARRSQAALDVDGRDMLEQAQRSLKRLGTMVDGLMAYARSGYVEEAPAPVDLGKALDEVLDTLRPQLQAAGARVEARRLPTVHGDATLLRLLLQNLVSNAVKYRAAAPPRIEVWAERDDGGHVVHVKDNGFGMRPGDLEKAFQPFKRMHPGRAEGSGLGLAIVRRIAEAHGGRVWAESEPGAGSTFHVRLPGA